MSDKTFHEKKNFFGVSLKREVKVKNLHKRPFLRIPISKLKANGGSMSKSRAWMKFEILVLFCAKRTLLFMLFPFYLVTNSIYTYTFQIEGFSTN